MADYKVTAGQLASIANAIRLKGGTSAALEYPSEWINAINNLNPSSGGSEITPADPTIEYKVTDTDLTAIANAIRTRGGTSESLAFPSDFVSAIENISGGGVEIVPWATGTDEQIAAMIQAAHNGDIDLQTDGGWAVGDTRTITVGAFTGGGNRAHAQQSVDIAISSFAEYMSCGNVMQFDFVNPIKETQNLNGSSISGNYGATYTKTTTLPNLVNALPTWLKDALIEFSVLATDKNGTLATVTGNKLALRSRKELFGDYGDGFDGEGVQVDYYIVRSNIPKKIVGNGRAKWWLRSHKNLYSQFMYVSDNSTPSTGGQNADYQDYFYIAPFGCL